MKPIRPRTQVWPFAALPSAAAVALVAASVGFAQDEPAALLEAAPSLTKTIRDIPVPSTPSGPAEDAPEFSYDVRLIEFAERPWRNGLKGQITPPGSGAEASAWILDTEGMDTLMKHFVSDPTAVSIQAPKVTALEGDRATFVFHPDGDGGTGKSVALERDFIEKFEKFKKNFRLGPIHFTGLEIDVRGWFTPRGTRISVNLTSPTNAITRRNQTNSPKAAAQPSQLDVVGQVHAGPLDIPTGSRLLVSTGRFEHRAGARSATRERLVVITPRRIVADPEPAAAPKTLHVPAAPPARDSGYFQLLMSAFY